MKLIFATGNQHKVREVSQMLKGRIQVQSLKDIGHEEDIPETQPTLEGNALQKARYVHERYGLSCFSEDTGLEVESLGGEPGVKTARYAGDAKDADANMNLLLERLGNNTNREARFRTVIALILDGEEFLFEGICNGKIARQKSGAGGFGYDPVFIPHGSDRSFAEMSKEEKNAVSHRGKAIRKLVDFLLVARRPSTVV